MYEVGHRYKLRDQVLPRGDLTRANFFCWHQEFIVIVSFVCQWIDIFFDLTRLDSYIGTYIPTNDNSDSTT